MDPFALLAVPAVTKMVDVIRYVVIEQSWRKLGYAVGAWTIGTIIMVILGSSSLAEDLGLIGLNFADMILAGVALGSTGSVLNDFSKKAPVEGHENIQPAVIINNPDSVTTSDHQV